MGLIGGIVFGRRRILIGWGIGRGGSQILQLVESTVERPLDAGFVAGERVDGAGTGGVVGVGTRTGIEVILVTGELRHAESEKARFDGTEAAQTPGGHGHLFDE